jgi:hypothetical protein
VLELARRRCDRRLLKRTLWYWCGTLFGCIVLPVELGRNGTPTILKYYGLNNGRDLGDSSKKLEKRWNKYSNPCSHHT